MVAGRSRSQGADTRTRILAAAVELFVERGYAGTSVRDIAERLGVTKAALYYHFSSKEMILEALISPFESGLAQLVELARRDPPPPPRAILVALTSLLVDTGAVLCAFANDPSVLYHRIGKDNIFSRQEAVIGALAGPQPTAARIMRARCAVGCVQNGVMGSAMDRMRGRGVSTCGVPVVAAGAERSDARSAEPAGSAASAASAVSEASGVSGVAAALAVPGGLGAGSGSGGGANVGWATTTGVGRRTGIRSLTGFTGDSGADGPTDTAVPEKSPGTSVAPGIGTAGEASPAHPVAGTNVTSTGTCAPAGVDALSPFAPLLPEELQRLIVEAALAALGPEQSMEPSAE
ncbi:transcriptional regulator, tetR family [Frankia sp. EI5c]|uniref:TetR/AcrR family transcriptional regulator n=1 Tax=Frankia sp. EI5c TaxID=683316 RepID=UPI0007C2359D|nr:TetR/AcrR family transcriptional regulator [Frankia sp. EI5c]OAA26187.1 transcriptional regulator, tetR family [Frankia sp. EI5c]